MRTSFKLLVVSLLILFNLVLSYSFADGLHQQEQNAAATAMGGAFVALANNPSALYFNPAGLSQLSGSQISLGGNLIFPSTTYTGTMGQFDMEDQVIHPTNLFFSHQVSDKINVGFGYYRPYAFSSKWGADFVGRFICDTFSFKTYNYNAAVAYQATPEISVAVGISYIHGMMNFRNSIDLSSYSQYYPSVQDPEGFAHFDATADNIGVNFGFLYKFDKFWTLGATYRSPLQLEFSGNFDFLIPDSPTGTSATETLNSLFPDQTGSMKYKIPQVLVIGVSTTVVNHTIVEADIQWSGWSSFKDLPVNYSTNTDALSDKIIDRRWKNAFAFRLGAEYEYKPTLLFRAGYYYDNSSIPGETLDPMVPDALKQSISGGVGIKWKMVTADAAYGLVFYEKRTEENQFLSGTYESFAQVLSLSLSFKF